MPDQQDDDSARRSHTDDFPGRIGPVCEQSTSRKWSNFCGQKVGFLFPIHPYVSGWWFGTFFIFPYVGNNHPN